MRNRTTIVSSLWACIGGFAILSTTGCEVITAIDDEQINRGETSSSSSSSSSSTSSSSSSSGTMLPCTVADDCPDPGHECLAKACAAGKCVPTAVAAGTMAASNVSGDCKVVTCDGNGASTSSNDDSDLPVDNKECTNDLCTNGVPSNPALAVASACGANMDLFCDGAGECVGCLDDIDCGVATDCTTYVCNMGGTCETQFIDVGTPLAMQTPGDCQEIQCNGFGGTKTVAVLSDVVSDGKSCTADVCVGMTTTYTFLPTGAACAEGSGQMCDGAGSCVECLSGADCSSFVCTDQACQPPTCVDTVKNGTESDTDCGGPACPTCSNGDHCITSMDCTSTVCGNGTCVASICNDSRITGNETCDDGNQDDADGCSSTCMTEPGYACTGEPSTCVFTCGDGIVDMHEECDDNDLDDGDGCSSVCLEEPGYDCSGAPSICFTTETNCGDGIDNNGNGQTDGADQNCQLPPYFLGCLPGESFYVFRSEIPSAPIPEGPIFQSPISVTGLGAVTRVAMMVNVKHTRVSDIAIGLDTPFNGFFTTAFQNGGTGQNFVNTLFDSACPTPFATVTSADAPFSACYDPLNSFLPLTNIDPNGNWALFTTDFEPGPDTGTIDDWALILCGAPPPVCGDGNVQPGEGCDDSNTMPTDGCSATCTVEPGYTCSGSPSVCMPCTTCENEPNNMCGQENMMTLSGSPLTGSMHGSTSSPNDTDYFTFTLPANATNVTIETFVGGPGQCMSMTSQTDTMIELFGPTCSQSIAFDDDGGIVPCSRILTGPAPAGQYWVAVRGFSGAVVNDYDVVVTATP